MFKMLNDFRTFLICFKFKNDALNSKIIIFFYYTFKFIIEKLMIFKFEM